MEVFPHEKNLNLKGLTNLINPNNPNPVPVGEVCPHLSLQLSI